ncbi:MAG: uracil-DNA glycosylase [Pseudomonadales bacterium]|nr:uracil-DNA glycosylase [Pseudomonadales bacterium]
MARQQGDRILLVGEAPGYKGCRITGIPFSSGALIRAKQHRIFEQIESDIYLTDIESENSASLVWQTLTDQDHYPLFWNAFPFHPHPKHIQNKNRAPNQKEMAEGESYLEELVELFSPQQIAGIGRKGAQSLERIFPDREVRYIRHPSYGGKKDFIAGMKQLLA